jgi:hypothetical protein
MANPNRSSYIPISLKTSEPKTPINMNKIFNNSGYTLSGFPIYTDEPFANGPDESMN